MIRVKVEAFRRADRGNRWYVRCFVPGVNRHWRIAVGLCGLAPDKDSKIKAVKFIAGREFLRRLCSDDQFRLIYSSVPLRKRKGGAE